MLRPTQRPSSQPLRTVRLEFKNKCKHNFQLNLSLDLEGSGDEDDVSNSGSGNDYDFEDDNDPEDDYFEDETVSKLIMKFNILF